MKQNQANKSFIVKVLSQDNFTWQGTITWIETGETQHFRSALELIKMIDSALENDAE